MTVRERLGAGRAALAGTLPPERAALDAEVLLAAVLGRGRWHLLAHPEERVAPEASAKYCSWLQRRAWGEPLEYLTGRADFYGLMLEVTPAVLVPRPETEVLVEAALSALRPLTGPLVVDVGTGSGAIALAVAANHPTARVLAVDCSLEALTVAHRNASAHSLLDRVLTIGCDLLSCLDARFDAVLANLPYVATSDLATVSAPVVRYEPRLALEGGPDGLALVKRLLSQARGRLAPGGTILAEIGVGQGDEAAAIAGGLYDSALVDLLPDLAGLDRVLRVRMAP